MTKSTLEKRDGFKKAAWQMNKWGRIVGGTSAHSLTHITHIKGKLQTCQVHNGLEEDNQFGSLATGGCEREIALLIC